jgi:phosphoribosylformylglycinamidine cyclo-ligase
MPGFYKDGDYDLSGFAVGIVDSKKLISGHNIVPGDTIIGLASSGLHSNGYSLVRKIFLSEGESGLNKNIPSLNMSLGKELLKPTRIYVSTILSLLKEFQIKGIAHITGGGFMENIPRILPDNVAVTIEKDKWPILPIFRLIKEKGSIATSEMFHTFNMGIGLILVVAKEDEEAVLTRLLQLQEQAYIIGKAQMRTETNRAIYIN